MNITVVVKEPPMNITSMNRAGYTIDDEEELGEQVNIKDYKSGFITIIGNPNVGKSTLMNAILGEMICIVSSKPQTTRHRILGVKSEHNYQMIFTDTPGMLEPVYKLQETMTETIKGAANEADVLLLVTDVYGEPLIDANIMERILLRKDQPVVIAINKIDLSIKNPSIFNSSQWKSIYHTSLNHTHLAKNISSISTNDTKPNEKISSTKKHPVLTVDELLLLWKARIPHAEIIPISAMKGVGIEALLSHLLSRLDKGPKYFPSDMISNRNDRFFCAEIIRESIFEIYKEEIPYSCEVVIDKFEEKSSKLTVIEATIVISKSTQKAIIIGQKGAMLKALGVSARQKIEKFLEIQVYLGLNVKVDEDWRSNLKSLAKYGYIDEED